MPHWAHREHKAKLGIEAPQVSVRLGQVVDYFVRRQQFPYKQVSRLLVAVAHQLTGFAQTVGPGRAQREQHHVGLTQEVARAAHLFLDGLQQLYRRVGPDAAVQVIALPAATGLHQVLLPVHFFARRGAQ